MTPRPDYARIHRLERELGLVDPPEPQSPFALLKELYMAPGCREAAEAELERLGVPHA